MRIKIFPKEVNMTSNRFQSIINKSVIDESGTRFVEVKHKGKLHRVSVVESDEELETVLKLDNQHFTGIQKISMKELLTIRERGVVLLCRDEDSKPVAFSQALFNSVYWQEVRMHEAFIYGTAGEGHVQILYKAQEVLAREARKRSIRLTVRPDNRETIRAAFVAGFRITEYDPTRYASQEEGGGRLVMAKNLITEQFPFEPEKQSGMIVDGKVHIATTIDKASKALKERAGKIAVKLKTNDEFNLETHHIIEEIMHSDYFGIGLLLPEEFESSDPTEEILLFQRSDLPPSADRLAFPLNVQTEYGRLREVVVSYTPENAQIREEYAINDVARMNVNNIDPIAFKDEYNLFVGTLVAHDVNVVHTNAMGKDGKSAIFTRDPAFVFGDIFCIAQLGQEQRMYESEGMRLVSDGRVQMELGGDPEAVAEGGDLILLDEKTIAVGIGQRTTQAGYEKLKECFPDYEFIPVPHEDLHLDVLFTMLGPRKCLADITQLPESFLRRLRDDKYEIIVADPEEQVSLGCNVVCLGPNKVVAARENENTNRKLEAAGVEVVAVSMPNIVKWGGGPRCMTCPTNRDS